MLVHVSYTAHDGHWEERRQGGRGRGEGGEEAERERRGEAGKVGRGGGREGKGRGREGLQQKTYLTYNTRETRTLGMHVH